MPNNTFKTKYYSQTVCSVLLYLKGRSHESIDILLRTNLISVITPQRHLCNMYTHRLLTPGLHRCRDHTKVICASHFFCLFSRAKRPRASVLRINGAMSSSPHDSRYSSFLAVDNELSDIKVAGQGKI